MNISKFLDTLRMALVSLISNKTRAILTVLGITIGVMTVVGLISLIQGLNGLVETEMNRMGTSALMVSRISFVIKSERQFLEENKRPVLTLEDADAIAQECSEVEYVSPRVMTSTPIVFRGKRTEDAFTIGTNEYFTNIQGVNIANGRGFSSSDVEHSRYLVLIGDDTAKALFSNEDPIGQRIRIEGRSFTVIGVLERMGQAFGQKRDNMVIMPITVFKKLFSDRSGSFRRLIMLIKAKDEKRLNETIDQVRRLLRTRRKVLFDDPDNFAIMTQDSLLESYRQLTGVVYAAMIGVGLISLIVGGVGIMNIMLVSVTERTKEIGIRLAVGAKRSDILMQFLVESASLSLLGGIGGIALGFVISLLIRAIVDLPATVPGWAILLAIGFSGSVGVTFGLYPAWRAAKSDPIQALRYE